jgi:hypothetical protein
MAFFLVAVRLMEPLMRERDKATRQECGREYLTNPYARQDSGYRHHYKKSLMDAELRAKLLTNIC